MYLLSQRLHPLRHGIEGKKKKNIQLLTHIHTSALQTRLQCRHGCNSRTQRSRKMAFVTSFSFYLFFSRDLFQSFCAFCLSSGHSEASLSTFTSSAQTSSAASDLCMPLCASLRVPHHFHLALMCSVSAGVPRACKFI